MKNKQSELDTLKSIDVTNKRVNLADYNNEYDYQQLTGNSDFNEHKKRISLRFKKWVKLGYDVKPIIIEPTKYFQWLGEKDNTTEQRATYVALKGHNPLRAV